MELSWFLLKIEWFLCLLLFSHLKLDQFSFKKVILSKNRFVACLSSWNGFVVYTKFQTNSDFTIKNSSVLIVKIQIALEFASIVLCVFFPNPAFYRAISILTLIIHFKRWLWNCINTYLFRSWSSAHDRLMFVAAFVVYDWCF